jgi:phage baseplate assembly protein gpV
MTHDSLVQWVNGQPESLRGKSTRKRTAKRVWNAFRSGREIDLSVNGKADRNGRLAARGAVGAEVIARILCTDPSKSHGARLALCGAQVTGQLDLSYARIEHPVTLRDCVFDQPIVLAEARLGALTLDGSSFPGIEAPNLEVDGDLGLSRVSSARTVNLTGARFHRDVRLRGAHLRRGEDQEVALAADHLVVDGSVTCDGGFEAAGTVSMAGTRVSGAVRLAGAKITGHGKQKIAFYGDGMTVGHDFNAQGLRAEGEVRLVDVSIASTLELRGAKLTSTDGVALRLDRAEISSSLYCDNGFTAIGDIGAIGTHVKGSVYFNNAELGRPMPASGEARPARTGVALRLVRAKIGGDLGCWERFVAHGTIDLARLSVTGEFRLLTTDLKGYPAAADLTNGRFATVAISGEPPAGFLDFTKAKADFFKDGPAHRRSGDIVLDEFEYRAIQMTLVTVTQREQWLLRAMAASRRKSDGDPDGYLPQPYEQLAEAYRRAGDDHAARRIELAKYRQRNRVISWRRWYSKLWNILQDGAIGYGYARSATQWATPSTCCCQRADCRSGRYGSPPADWVKWPHRASWSSAGFSLPPCSLRPHACCSETEVTPPRRSTDEVRP